MKVVCEEKYPAFCKKFEKCLGAGKFILGDKTTIYDCQVAGLWTNLICNPTSKDPELWAKTFEEHTPDRVKQYVADFKAANEAYLAGRVQGSTM